MMSMSGVQNLCALCGQRLVGRESLCAAHHTMAGEEWAAVNRIMCDFLHRGVATPRLGPSERRDLDDRTGGVEAV